jgi:hypothetical protein
VLVGMVLVPTVNGVAVAYAQQPATTAPLVFDGVTVIDVQQGRRLAAQRVVIVGNRIRTVGSVSTVRMPTGARVVDAHGKYLIPGLWDMHTHSARSTELFYPLFLANGVTGIRDAGSPVPLDTLLLWRREIVTGTRVGPPRQILSGQSITDEKEKGRCDRGERQRDNRLQTCVSDSADARHVVDSLKAAGADMIKPRDVKRAMWFVIAAEARRMKIPFGGHTEEETPIEASDSGASIVDHLDPPQSAGMLGINQLCWGDDATVEHCQPVAEHFRRNGTWFVPTLFYYGDGGFLTERAEGLSYIRPVYTRFAASTRAFWNGSLPHGNWLRGLADSGTHGTSTAGSSGAMHVMQRVGLPILAGTDIYKDESEPFASPGFALHAELAMYVAEGLTPLEALQTATLNPAKLLHATDSLGTVASGKLADLVLLDADPLADITNTTAIRSVVANGRYFDRAALDQLLTDVQTKAKRAP